MNTQKGNITKGSQSRVVFTKPATSTSSTLSDRFKQISQANTEKRSSTIMGNRTGLSQTSQSISRPGLAGDSKPKNIFTRLSRGQSSVMTRLSRPAQSNNKKSTGMIGKGRKGRNFAQKKAEKKLTAENLDKSLENYMLKNPKTAQSYLDKELDDYMDTKDVEMATS